MTRLLLSVLTILVILALPGKASARDNAGVVQLRTAPTGLRPDAAYLLMTVSKAKSGMLAIQPVMLRIPTAEESSAYLAAKKAAYAAALPGLVKKAKGNPVPNIDEFEFNFSGKANSFVVKNGEFLEDGEMRTVLLEAPPGTYILYGITLQQDLITCNCLGTVMFAARPGVITHVGAIYTDKVHKASPLPHLEDNLGASMFQYGFVLGEALVPADATTVVPASLKSLPLELAQFDVVGEYYEPGAVSINRLAPIPGLLSYEHGRAVDARTGKLAE